MWCFDTRENSLSLQNDSCYEYSLEHPFGQKVIMVIPAICHKLHKDITKTLSTWWWPAILFQFRLSDLWPSCFFLRWQNFKMDLDILHLGRQLIFDRGSEDCFSIVWIPADHLLHCFHNFQAMEPFLPLYSKVPRKCTSLVVVLFMVSYMYYPTGYLYLGHRTSAETSPPSPVPLPPKHWQAQSTSLNLQLFIHNL